MAMQRKSLRMLWLGKQQHLRLYRMTDPPQTIADVMVVLRTIDGQYLTRVMWYGDDHKLWHFTSSNAIVDRYTLTNAAGWFPMPTILGE